MTKIKICWTVYQCNDCSYPCQLKVSNKYFDCGSHPYLCAFDEEEFCNWKITERWFEEVEEHDGCVWY